MKKAIAIALLTTLGLAAQAPAGAKTTSSKTAKKTVAAPTPPAVKDMTIPPDAIATPDGSYSWTDKQGKHWRFVKTPFGIIKSEAQPAPADSTPMENVKAIDAGDKVRFETSTPFGIVKREKSKADLTDDERRLYESQNPTPAAKQD